MIIFGETAEQIAAQAACRHAWGKSYDVAGVRHWKCAKCAAVNKDVEDGFRRYLVFVFSTYYPGGGLADIEASFDREDHAVAYAKNANGDTVYVVDHTTMKTVWEKK